MTEDRVAVYGLTKAEAKELGTRPVSEGVTAGEIDALIHAERSLVGEAQAQSFMLHQVAPYLRALLSMARQSLGGGSGTPIGRNITFLPSSDEANAVISPDEPEGAYWTLIGQGSDDEQNAIATEIVRRLNTPAVTSPPKGEEDHMEIVNLFMVAPDDKSDAPKAEEEPVAWFRNSQQNPKMWYQVETHELKHYRERGCTLLPLLPLLPRPNPVSAELVEAGKAVEAAITAFANMALLAVPADHNPTVRAVLGEGLYNARERLRAALSAHAGGTV